MKKLLFIFFIITLSGCSQLNQSTTSHETTNKTWDEQQQQLQQLTSWTITGKLAIFLDNERQTANLHWHQEGDNYKIQLTSFIGTRVLQITKNEQGVEIINNDGDKFVGSDVNTLIKKLAPNLAFPVSALQQWIKGDPDEATYIINSQQQVKELTGTDKSGSLWTVHYQQYQSFSGYILPTMLDLKRDKIRAKIAINQWTIATN
ncbi:outer membrane lipoprotein LolB [Psychromonas sp. RZ22]|uniref:lipoprotein insertase outer membrane protein LolB n=1 Tax=Psychromonas algarum TaxID=2555643 RepID=UPI00106772FE|nr:lipoprotein insertase outer membrane protein LolB [Psychromonas sp. RZ22]TEW53619.1 outer membrane lipoprotein LolB [Psychromonas sp. RZ22]